MEAERVPLLVPRTGDYNGSHTKSGLGVCSAACYLLSLVGVTPLIALPAAVANSGYAGVVMTIVMVSILCYTILQLSEAWQLAETFYPHLATPASRHPYPVLGEIVGGSILRRIISFIQDLALFGSAVPFLLMASESLQSAVSASGGADISFCYWLVILTVLLLPVVWLATPKDLKMVAWTGAGLVVVSSACMFVALVLDFKTRKIDPEVRLHRGFGDTFTIPSWTSMAYCFGAMAFQFGIHPALLTVQGHMRDGRQLSKAVSIAFAGAYIVYVPVVAIACYSYGNTVSANILSTIPQSMLLTVTAIVVVLQALLCLCLGINVLFLDLEELLGLPGTFGCGRLVMRTSVMASVLLLCESLPHFGVAIELIGGLLVTPLIFILPPVFNIIMKYRCLHSVGVLNIGVSVVVVCVGVVGCLASTTESVMQLILQRVVPLPCYLDLVGATNQGHMV